MDKERFLSKEFLLHTFNEFDKNGSGTLDSVEIKNVLGMVNKSLMDDSISKKIIDEIDKNNDG
jgi:Ca2+-binding EF-hand superfamily protein